MARNTLGALVVSLGLDAANYIAGLTKAEYQAKKATDNIRRQFSGVGRDFARSLGTQLAGVFSATAVVLWTKGVLDAAEALQDLSEETGSTVENLSRLANIAKIQGTSLDEFRSTVEKFSAGLGGLDDETGKFAKQMALLGVTTRDPAKALEEVAKAFNTFADGAGKATAARILFGKAGVGFLSTLKAIGSDTDTVATRTREQARAADELNETLRKLSVQSQEFANILLSSVVPAVSRLLDEFLEGRRIAGGFFEAIALFGTLPTTSNLKQTADAIDEISTALAEAKRSAGTGFGQLFDADKAVSRLEKQLAYLRSVQRRQLAEFARDDPSNFDVRDILARRKPPIQVAGGADKAGRGARERESEAERYIKQLERQLVTVQELTVAEETLLEITVGSLKDATKLEKDRALAAAQNLDAEKARIKAGQEATRAAEEMAQVEQDRARAAADREAQGMREIDQIRESNQQLEDEIFLIGKDEAAHTALAQARIEDEIALRRRNLEQRDALELTALEVSNIEKQIALLQQRQTLLAQRDVARTLAEEAQKAKQFYDDLGGAIASSFEEAIINGNNLRDVIKGLEQDLVRIITRKMVTEPLANAISSGLSGGGGNLLSSLLGGFNFGSSGGGASFGGYVGTFASGGTSPGGWAMVGERGPEIVNLPKGAQVIPNAALQQKRGERASVNIYQSFAPGTDRKTVGQAAAAAGKAVRRGLERYA